ncbi:RsbRD N-terminal domain-containing protein [Desulfovibrio litoralis]|uniref:RsbT co-antagonist protein rsbRD N-terminal domain-containing protein n=1 Tax=Desulfovibrio litoralis DSM 11393 TaxID=1121455 RepID=A0A1M7S012_9BACT|nr:RsbRD N-terminal domain-containing protein [Desulfovibrio litoralis]SHN51770.1 RsbT co-antagonist protein rsbRD N-terminal domain-containing protein [Desulfovibrio litoralis DSM 11393]
MNKTSLKQLITEHKDKLLEDWTTLVYSGYAFDTAGFLRTKNDQFTNPVGWRTTHVGESLIKAITNEHVNIDELNHTLDEFIRVRAVQDFTPEQALAVLFLMKECILKRFKSEIKNNNLWLELWDISSRLDGISLLSFSFYIKNREVMFNLKLEDYKRRHSQIMRKAGLLVAADDPESKDS